jgi:hypothetical protein
VAKALLTAILCVSYKTEAAALSKLNLVGKILAHVSQAISHDTSVCRPTNGGNRQHGSPAASQMVDLHEAPVRPDGENERKQVMVWLPLRLPLATELLTR